MKDAVETTPEHEQTVSLDSPKLFINRELSSVQFQYRVLEEAIDETNPVLERVKFLPSWDLTWMNFLWCGLPV